MNATPEYHPFQPGDSVSSQTLANVAAMEQELSYLRSELETARAGEATLRSFYDARFNVIAQQLSVRSDEVVELEALLEKVDTWRTENEGTGLAEASSIELRDILASIDNAPLAEHDQTVRADALRELVQLVLDTTNDEALAGEIKRTWYERALQDVHARLSARLELEG